MLVSPTLTPKTAAVRWDSGVLRSKDEWVVEVAAVGTVTPGTTPVSKDVNGDGVEVISDIG